MTELDQRHGAPEGVSSATRTPVGFWVWLLAALASSLGSMIIYFGLNWFASAFGGRVSGLVATLSMLPRALLLLLGGAVGDKYGPRRVMIIADALMLAIMLGLAVAVGRFGVTVAILIVVSALSGAVSAFYGPANSVFPRLFVEDEELPRAMSRAGTLMQVARLLGPPVGGVLIVWTDLTGLALIDAASFIGIVIVLVVIRPPREDRATRAAQAGLRSVGEGLVTAFRSPGVTPLLGAVALIAGGVIPSLSLCIPLAARERGWVAADAGLIEGTFIAGGFVVSLVFVTRGPLQRAGIGMVSGPVVVACGLGGLALSPTAPVAAGSAFAVGVGVVLFTAHLFPLYLMRSPDGMQSRFQALLVLVQAVPVLLVNLVYGQIAAASSVTWSMLLAAVIALSAGAWMAAVPSARTARLAPRSTHSG